MIDTAEIFARLIIGALLGGLIGFERQAHGRPAGLRTHILVSTASVLVMAVSRNIQGGLVPDYLRMDPARLAAGAITGIGFLGAGVIIKSGVTVQGLTTAASIWIVAVIGLAVGEGLYAPAVAASAITFFTLWTLRIIEGRISRITFKTLTVVCGEGGDEEAIGRVLASRGVLVENRDYERDVERFESTLTMTVSYRGEVPLRAMLEEIAAIPRVKKVFIRT